MSTKTSIKRIALVAVSALGFGLLSVAPSNAAAVNNATATVASYNATRVTTTCVVSSACVVNVGAAVLAEAKNGTNTNNLQIRTAAYLSTYPAGGASAVSAGTLTTPNEIDTATTTASGNVLTSAWANDTAIVAETVTSSSTAATGGFGKFTFTPQVAGTYVLTIWNDADAGADVDLSETVNTISITVSAATAGLTELGNAATTTASAAADLVGLLVPTVGATIDEVSGRVGQMVGFAPHYFIKRNAGHAGASANTNTAKANLNYSVTGPTGAAVSVVTAKVAGVASTEQNIAGDAGTITTTATASTTTTTSTKGSVVYFNPATAGTYTITVWHDADGNDLVSAGEASATKTVVIAADALPSITFTKYGSNATAAQSADGQWGQLVKVSLRNGANAWTLAANESLVLTSAATTTDFLAYASFSKDVASWNDVASGISTLTLTAANFNSSGDSYFNIGDTTSAGGTFSVSAVVNGGTANGASGSFTITTTDTSAAGYALVGDSTTAFTNANGYLGVDGNGATIANGDNAKTWSVKLGVATTVSAKVVSGANNYKLYNGLVTDTLGLLTGVAGAKYNVNALTLTTGAVATSAVSLSVSIPATTAALASGTTVATMLIDKATDATLTITATSSSVDSVSTDPSDLVGDYSIRAAAASTNKFTAYVWDQFGNAVTGAACTAAVTGRNATTVATSLVSDATGAVSFSVTDTYTGTLLNSDSLVFTCSSLTSTVTINYATYNPASTVTITGGASADIAPTVTYNTINTTISGASGTLVKMTATVKDANGATLPAGIPVKWAISGLTGTSAIYVDPTTGYDWSTSMTDSNGAAITYVYAWGTGTVSVTATAGAVTSATAGKINFANAAADARVVSATVKNNIITAKVVDRYGNPVKGVSLSATRNSGVGYFSGSASSSATGETNALGTVDFVMTGGAANVTVATTTLNAGQTSSAAAAVNGTAITATSIGASLSPAGVQSVTVDVASDAPSNIAAQDAANAAADAAAEAIDAANAATDAANLAAEAADAATVAAEEARDAADAATAAVEELATQVATLMAALKAQITTLANTVAKIAKKVKA